MVQKSVLRKIGVFAMTVMLAASPIMAVNAKSANQMAKAASGTGDTTSDPAGSETPAPVVPTPKPVVPAPAVDEDNDVEDENTASYVVTTKTGQVLVSTVPGVYNVSCVPGVAITTPAKELPSGMTIEVNNSRRGEKAAKSIQDGLDILKHNGVSATKGPEIDIAAYVNFASKTDLDQKVTISIGIPSEFKEAGHDYAVMLIQAGGRVSILPNISPDPEYITVSTSGLGVYVIVKAPAGSFKMFQ